MWQYDVTLTQVSMISQCFVISMSMTNEDPHNFEDLETIEDLKTQTNLYIIDGLLQKCFETHSI